VLENTRHRQRMQRLQEQGAETAHPGRGIGLHPPAHTVRTEQTSLTSTKASR